MKAHCTGSITLNIDKAVRRIIIGPILASEDSRPLTVIYMTCQLRDVGITRVRAFIFEYSTAGQS